MQAHGLRSYSLQHITISDDYRAQQQRLHENPNYGVASVEYAPLVTQIINSLQVDEMLDYGCGKGRLAQAITPGHNVNIQMYDPAIPQWSEPPKPSNFVTCIDVLEHIEPEYLHTVLNHLKKLVNGFGFFSVHTGPAVKVLDDGRNAHLIQEDFRFWLPKIWKRFHVHSFTHVPQGFYCVVQKR